MKCKKMPVGGGCAGMNELTKLTDMWHLRIGSLVVGSGKSSGNTAGLWHVDLTKVSNGVFLGLEPRRLK